MARCPECHSKDVTIEKKRIEEDETTTSKLVMKSWLEPGAVLKNRKHFRTETVARCESCGHTWTPRTGTEIGMAIIGAVILVCVILLEIFGK